jgi:hypothetical protein
MERNNVPRRYRQAQKANALFARHRNLCRELAAVAAWSVRPPWYPECRRELALLNQTLARMGLTN